MIPDPFAPSIARVGFHGRRPVPAPRECYSKEKEQKPVRPCCKTRMDKTIRKYTSLDEMKADEYRYWQSRPVHERMDAVEELICTAYELKGWQMEPDVPRLQRPFVRLPCPWC